MFKFLTHEACAIFVSGTPILANNGWSLGMTAMEVVFGVEKSSINLV